MNTAVAQATPTTQPVQPWWRYPMVWLVISGPLSVVVASLVSAAVAWSHIDPVITTSNGRFGADDDMSTTTDPKAPLAPALKARNHAATPAR